MRAICRNSTAAQVLSRVWRSAGFKIGMDAKPGPSLVVFSIGTRSASYPLISFMVRTARILIVDDLPDIAEIFAYLFRHFGYESRIASDGLQAIAIAEEFRPGFVLLDLGLPNINGFETAKRIRNEAWSRGMVLIALSGHWSKEYQRFAQEVGFDRYLCKPMPVKDIVALIEELSHLEDGGVENDGSDRTFGHPC